MMDRSTIVVGMLMVATLGLGACDDDVGGTWRLQDREWEMVVTLESDGTGEYRADHPDFGDGVLTWADRGSVNGHYLDFECETGCDDPSWRWTCSFVDDGAALECSTPGPFNDETYVFVQDQP